MGKFQMSHLVSNDFQFYNTFKWLAKSKMILLCIWEGTIWFVRFEIFLLDFVRHKHGRNAFAMSVSAVELSSWLEPKHSPLSSIKLWLKSIVRSAGLLLVITDTANLWTKSDLQNEKNITIKREESTNRQNNQKLSKLQTGIFLNKKSTKFIILLNSQTENF